MPRSFDDYATGQGLTPLPASAAKFFDARPDLLAEVRAARAAGHSWTTIHEWLRQEHGFQPKQSETLRKFITGSARA